MPYSLGVDLGTTVVTAAVAGPTAGRMVVLGAEAVGAPAVVHVGNGGVVATGDEAERRAAGSPDRLVGGLRRRLGEDRPVLLGAAAYPVTGLLGAQLRDVVRRVARAEGGPPDRVVLTCPASWDDLRRARFEEVIAAAGVAAPLVVTEPAAAVTAMASALQGSWSDGETVAVYDLGGGSFHATVLRRRGDGLEIVGTPEGDERLGGVDFDEAVLRHVAEVAGVPIAADGTAARAALTRLRRECARAKEALSVHPEATVPVSLAGRSVEVRLTRTSFEELVHGPVEATMHMLSRTIRSAGLLPSDVRAVLPLGGSSRIPLVAEMLSQQFGRPFVRDVDPKNVVALGAAALGARSIGAGSAPRAGRTAVRPAAATHERPGPPVGGTVAPILADPGGDGGPGLPVGPAPLLTTLDPRLPPPDPDADAHPRRSLTRAWLPIASATVAVLVLVVVFVVARGGTPDVPPAVPAGSPPSATAPASTAPASTAPASTRAPATTAPTSRAAPTTTTAAPPRATTGRSRTTAPRSSASRTTRSRATTTKTR